MKFEYKPLQVNVSENCKDLTNQIGWRDMLRRRRMLAAVECSSSAVSSRNYRGERDHLKPSPKPL